MERARRIEGFWAWLPAFRAVAEREHVGQAAQALGISTSAVSRTVSLLEDDLGVELLRRRGRGVELTLEGRTLQSAVRDAMRIVDEALRRFDDKGLQGVVKIATTDPLTELVLQPALAPLRQEHPGLVVELSAVPYQDAPAALRRGAIDLALLRAPVRSDELQVQRVGEAPLGLYSAALAREFHGYWRLEELGARPFVAAAGPHGSDHWPLPLERNLVGTTVTFAEAVELASSLQTLVVLPRLVGDRAVAAGRLQRVATEPLRPLQLTAMWRTPLSLPTPADAVMAAIGKHTLSC